MIASRNTILRNLLVPAVMLTAGTYAHAQQNSSLSGTVTDQAGAAVPHAHVTIKEAGTGTTKSVDTNDAGGYSFPGLNLGTYDVTVTMQGFQTTVQKGVVVNISQDVKSDVSLAVGNVDQTVTVTANALAIQTDTNVVSTLVSSEEISEIATENRNFASLVALGLGASSLLPDNNTPTSVGSSAAVSFNGLRQSHNIWLIDGGEADDRGGAGGSSIEPSQEAIAQIETLSSNYPPDYGISSGATISMGLKSGGQKFHGELWEFNRNSDYNANSYYLKQANQPRQKLDYNIYGFNVSGPIFIPKVYNHNKDKAFFFWNEEWRSLKQGSSPDRQPALIPSNIPTAGKNLNYETPGFLSSSAVQLTIPTAAQVGDPAFIAKLAADGLAPSPSTSNPNYFPNNVIPSNLFDSAAVAYLNTGVIPTANAANGYNVVSVPSPTSVRDDVVRIDYNLTNKWQVLFHYLHDNVSQGSGSPMIGWSGSSYDTVQSTFTNPSKSWAVKVAGQIKPNLLLEASLNYDGNTIDIVSTPNGNLANYPNFKAGSFFANGYTSLPSVHFGAPFNTSEAFGSAPWHNQAGDYEPKVDLSYTLGKHALKFGASFNRYSKDQKLFLDAEGDYYIGDLTGDSEVDFILGLTSSYSQAQAAPIRDYINNTPSMYAQDTWQVTPKISLQLGFRYDALPHAYETHNQVANFNPNLYSAALAPSATGAYISTTTGQLNPSAPGFSTVAGGTQSFYLNGITLAGVYGTPHGLVNNDYSTFQPRVGFSAHILDDKTVLRGGVGTFYERLQGNDIYNAATNAPFANTPSASHVYVSNPTTTYLNGSTASLPTYAQGLTSLAPTYKAPAVAQYSLGVQRELRPSVVATVQYVGNLAWHQNIDRNINTYPLNTSPTIRQQAGFGQLPNSGDFYRTYQGFGGITQQENTTNGGYNGLQIGVRSQGVHGLSGEVDYTYSHEIDVTSYDLNGVSNPFNLKYDRASGAFDRRHILSTNYVYKLPIFAKSQGLEHSLLGGWELAGTFVLESGTIIGNNGPTLNSGEQPNLSGGTYSLTGFDPVGLGGGYTNRPNILGKVKYLKHHGGQWIDTSNFSQPLAAWAGSFTNGFGTAGRDSVLGPGRANFTTSLYKNFAITERVNFEFRAETFNTFNHTEFSSLNNGFQETLQSPNSSTLVPNSSFGQVNGTYDPRNVEFGAKLKF